MLELEVSGEFYNEKSNQFHDLKPRKIRFEHSLLSLSEWESKWRVPFLKDDEKSDKQAIDYIRMMALDPINEDELRIVVADHMEEIIHYISESHTATTISSFSESVDRRSALHKQVWTSELIYFYMFSFGIPKECETWNLSRLMALIEIFSIKNSPSKKMSRRKTADMYRQINEQRRMKNHSKG